MQTRSLASCVGATPSKAATVSMMEDDDDGIILRGFCEREGFPRIAYSVPNLQHIKEPLWQLLFRFKKTSSRISFH